MDFKLPSATPDLTHQTSVSEEMSPEELGEQLVIEAAEGNLDRVRTLVLKVPDVNYKSKVGFDLGLIWVDHFDRSIDFLFIHGVH